MKRFLTLLAAVALLLGAIAPVAECFDRWDHDAIPAHDTELGAAAWVACAGLVAAVLAVVRFRHALMRSAPVCRSSENRQPMQPAQWHMPDATSSPPLMIVSLRI